MHIVDTTKFGIACALLVVGIAILVRARGQRGFNQTRQAGALMLIGSVIFAAIGLGYLNV